MPIAFLIVRVKSGCGSVDRAVTSIYRRPRFESSHRQKIILNIYCQLSIENTETKKKRPEMAAFLKKKF